MAVARLESSQQYLTGAARAVIPRTQRQSNPPAWRSHLARNTLTSHLDHQATPLKAFSELAEATSINILDPLTDSRWFNLTAKHPNASVFHQSGWLRALAETYGYEPLVLTTGGPNEQLKDGIVLCRLNSWLSGNRLVSLPFSDHCDPLLDGSETAQDFMNFLRGYTERLRYVEVRPLFPIYSPSIGLEPAGSFCFHELDLGPSLNQIFGRMHANSYRRKIRRAERESLSYESGRSTRLLSDFYRLLIKTRRRHGLIPQPFRWFKNLVKHVKDELQIRLVRKDGKPIAAMLTLRHASRVVYKYGCSDEAHHHRGGMPFLFWKFIEESKESGAASIDLGRSDLDNPGLILFKDRLGASRRTLTYYRYTNPDRRPATSSWNVRGALALFANLPDVFLSAAGRLFYKHLG